MKVEVPQKAQETSGMMEAQRMSEWRVWTSWVSRLSRGEHLWEITVNRERC